MRRVIAFLPAVALWAVAASQAPSDPFEACAQKTDGAERLACFDMAVCAQKTEGPERLACFDQAMQRRHSQSTHPEAHEGAAAAPARAHDALPATVGTAVGAGAAQAAGSTQGGSTQGGSTQGTPPPNAADANVGSANVQPRAGRHSVVKEPPPKPIVAQVERSLSHPDHRYTFYLDNGQVWEQVETQQGLYVNPHEKVTITAGVLGSFFMETPKHRFVRVRLVE
jgi:hypothetical protein